MPHRYRWHARSLFFSETWAPSGAYCCCPVSGRRARLLLLPPLPLYCNIIGRQRRRRGEEGPQLVDELVIRATTFVHLRLSLRGPYSDGDPLASGSVGEQVHASVARLGFDH